MTALSTDDYYPGSKRKRREAAPVVEFIPDPWREDFTVKTIGGKEVRLYTISALASALGVSVPSIRLWEKKGYIPQGPYRLPSNMLVHGQRTSGRRLYTEELIDAAVAVFEEHGILGSPRIMWERHSQVPIEIHDSWKSIMSNNRIGNA